MTVFELNFEDLRIELEEMELQELNDLLKAVNNLAGTYDNVILYSWDELVEKYLYDTDLTRVMNMLQYGGALSKFKNLKFDEAYYLIDGYENVNIVRPEHLQEHINLMIISILEYAEEEEISTLDGLYSII